MRKQLGLPPVQAADATTLDWTEHAPTDLERKRIIPRVTSIVSAAVPVFDTDECDCLDITDLVEDIVSMTAGMSGAPRNFQHLMVRVFSRAVRQIEWGPSFRSSGVSQLLTVTVPGQTHQVGLEFNTAQDTWICLATDVLGY